MRTPAPKVIRDKDTWAMIRKNSVLQCARRDLRDYNRAIFESGQYKIEVKHRYVSQSGRESIFVHVKNLFKMHFYYRGPLINTRNFNTHHVDITRWSVIGKTTIEDLEHMMVILKLTRGD